MGFVKIVMVLAILAAFFFCMRASVFSQTIPDRQLVKMETSAFSKTISPHQPVREVITPHKAIPVEDFIGSKEEMGRSGWIPKESYSGRVIFKFREGSAIRLRTGELTGDPSSEFKYIKEILKPYKIKRLFRSKSEEDYQRETIFLQRRTAEALPDLNLYYEVQIVAHGTAWVIIKKLRHYRLVETVYMDPVPVPAAYYPATPSYQDIQKYLGSTENGGIDAEFAWTVPGGRGEGVRVVDIEYSWNLRHEDLPLSPDSLLSEGCDDNAQLDYLDHADHGTAVAGILVALDNGFGMTGIVPEATMELVSDVCQSMSTVIDKAATHLGAGDIMLLEAQILGPYGTCLPWDQDDCVPIEWPPANFAVIQRATFNRIIVVEAAGNGGNDLDSVIYGGAFDTAVKNSGAIVVGAGDPTTHAPLDFSNYGSRVELQGWGRQVATTGYGDLASLDDMSDNRDYTASFGGTSSASPIVVGALAALQGIYRHQFPALPPPPSGILKDILIATGTPQSGRHHIGPLPNLREAIPRLELDNDGDEIPDTRDNCAALSSNDQTDRDEDGIGDVCDNCPNSGNLRQEDIDDDGIGNICDTDMDNDGILDEDDDCEATPDPDQSDLNNNGIGDVCDTSGTIALDPNTPVPAYVPIGEDVEFTRIQVTAGIRDIRVYAINISRRGIGRIQDITSIELYDGDKRPENKLGDAQYSFLRPYYRVPFGVSWKIPARQTRTLSIWAKIIRASSQHALGIAARRDISLERQEEVIGIFPLYGAQMVGAVVSP